MLPFINSTEISVQEADYMVVGMHLSETSNAEVYIDTNSPEKRMSTIKTRNQLQNMSDSTNIFCI